MGMCALGYIFQDSLDKLLGNIEGVKMYIDDMIVSDKDSFEKHIHQMRIIFGRLHASGLKVNALKFSFGLNNIH